MRIIEMRRALGVLALASGLALGQNVEDKSTEHRSYPGTRELIIDNVTGAIEVTASSSSSVEVDIEKTLSAWSQDRLTLAKKEISLAERREGGLVELMVDGPFRCHCSDNSINFHDHDLYEFVYNFKIRVPRDIKLDLRTVNHSDITVTGTAGDFKIRNVNGGIEMHDIEGSGSVSTVNGPVKVTFARNPAGATSFKSVNGTLDVTFRTGLNADLKMKTMNGGMYTDFPVSALPVAAEQPEHRNGMMVWRKNRMTGARIGSGGPELAFETVNGEVLIRNREK
jgi:DUF4097 and DUF4098 domain-containing protein YvlB